MNQIHVTTAEINKALGDRYRWHWLRALHSTGEHRWAVSEHEVDKALWAALSRVQSAPDPLQGLIALARDYG